MAWNGVWVCCTAGVDSGESSLHTGSRQAQSVIVGGWWSFLWVCGFKPCKEAVEVVEQRDVVVERSVAQASFIPGSEGVVSGPQQLVDIPCQPWLQVSPNDDGLCMSQLIDALHARSNSVCVLLNVCVVVACGFLLKHFLLFQNSSEGQRRPPLATHVPASEPDGDFLCLCVALA